MSNEKSLAARAIEHVQPSPPEPVDLLARGRTLAHSQFQKALKEGDEAGAEKALSTYIRLTKDA